MAQIRKSLFALALGTALALGNLAYALSSADITTKDSEILFQGKTIHPGCLRTLATELNGDSVSMVVNIEFEKPDGQFVGRGCMSANKYYQPTFTRNGYLAYAQEDGAFKKALKDPLLRIDGFGYKLLKKIDDKTFAVDVREFTTGSSDFLSTLLIQVEEHQVILITPDRKSITAKVIGFKKLGEVLNGTTNWQDKLQDALKTRQKMEKEFKKKETTI